MIQLAMEDGMDIEALLSSYDADIYAYKGEISRFGYQQVSGYLRGLQSRRDSALLILSTFGGDADAAYRIARAFRHYYPDGQFTILVPKECKSAGTLLAIGASELVLCDESELGPLDVQLSKQDELVERTSGLDIMQALAVVQNEALSSFRRYLVDLSVGSGRISVKTAAEMSSNLVTGLFAPVYAQIDPTKLGEIQRAISIAEAYGKRLDRRAKNLKKGALQKLITGYPSHGFVIDRSEAKDLFESVRPPSEFEELIAESCYQNVTSPSYGEPTFVGVNNSIEKQHEETTGELYEADTENASRASSGEKKNSRAKKPTNGSRQNAQGG